ncbi:MAG: hypothetical protein M1450_05235 [Patescibacteria group bacterium]|nr:hypothetical protein [Patescibacteria group bacterium]
MKTSARILGFVFAFLLLLTFVLPKSVSAQQQLPIDPNFDNSVPATTHNLTQGILIDILSAFSCQLAGVDPVNPDGKCLGVDPQTGKIGFVEQGNGGVVGVMGGMISMLYTPPIHSTDFIAYMGNNFGIAKHTYAAQDCKAGYGFCSISPLSKIWSGFRNIVYMIFVLLFVIIGIAIMLRIKIDPRTVMTIENQIPKILIGIILVTFSLAIAGFLIDFMYMGIYLVFNIFTGTGVLTTDSLTKVYTTTSSFQTRTSIGVFNEMFGFIDLTGNISVRVADLISSLVQGAPGNPFNTPVIGEGLKWIPAGIAYFIVLIALLWAMFRLWFQLLLAYFGILVDIVTAPFWIMAGSMPGGFGGVSLWFRDLFSNLLAFPTTIVILLLGRSFIDAFGSAHDKGQTIFVPPMVGNFNGALFGQLIGLGTILIAPKALDYMRNALKAPKFDFSPITNALGVGTGAPGGMIGRTAGVGSTLFGLSNVPGVNRLPFISSIKGQRGAAPPPPPASRT